MNIKYLTKGYIKPIESIINIPLNISLSEIKNAQKYSFVLIIQSNIENSLKITIYPLNKDKIIKLSLFGLKISTEIMNKLSKVLQNFPIIHSSGFLRIKNYFLYECYLNLNFSEIKSEDLKISLDTIRNRFKEIKLEEISLKNIKRE